MNDLRVKVGGDTSGFELAMAKVRGEARKLASSLTQGIGGRIAGFFAVGAMVNAARQTAAYAGQLADLSARTGVSVEALQRLDRAAKENGTSLDALVGLWERVGSAREDALKDKNSGAAKAFGALGVSQGMLSTGSPDEIVRKIADAFQNSANVEQLIAPLREIGGRGAGQMIALFRAGLDQQYQDMQVMTGEQAELLDELDDKWSTLGLSMKIFLAGPLIKLIEGIQWLGNQVEQTVAGIKAGWEWLLGNQGKNLDADVAAKGLWEAMQKAIISTKADQDNLADANTQARRDRAAKKLKFGKFDPNSVEANEAKFPISELKLDDLSKAGLFAGGKWTGVTNNIPERQLSLTERIVSQLDRANETLTHGLG